MRVLVTVPPLDRPGGVANYYLTLRNYFPDNIEYFTAGSQADNQGVLATTTRLLSDYYKFYKRIRRGNYDLVHLNPSLGPKAIIRDGIFLLITKALGYKSVVFIRGWDAGFERTLRKYWLAVFRYVYRKADAVIVLGDEFRNKLVEMGCTQEIYIETTVVDDTVFSSRNNADTRDDGAGKAGLLNILTLTRIEKAKGIYEVIEAYRILKQKFPLITLTMAGDGIDLKALKEYVRLHEIMDVTFPGYVRDDLKKAIYEDADIYFFPTSYGEGMPNAVLEAMAYGLPVITRPVGGMKDFFQNGKMGYMTSSTAPEEFAALIEDLLKDPELRRRISLFNRDYALNHFTASSVAGRLQGIYRKVLDESATH